MVSPPDVNRRVKKVESERLSTNRKEKEKQRLKLAGTLK